MSLLRSILLILFLAAFSPAGWAQWLPDTWSSINLLSGLLDLGGEWDGGDIREVIENIIDEKEGDSISKEKRSTDFLRMQFIMTAARLIEQKEGYNDEAPSYPGSAWQSRLRAAVKGRSYSFYALAESDAGESVIPFSDHRTVGFEAEPIRKHLKLIFGDYSLDHGLGLLFSTRTIFSGWTQEPHMLVYRSRGIRANSSANEDRFLRGGGIQWSKKGWRLTGFFSDKSIDAQLIDGELVKFRGSGYHRTAGEIEMADQLDEKVHGLLMQYTTDWLQTGGGCLGMVYGSKKVIRSGWYAKIKIPGGMIFGELAGSDFTGLAASAGLSYFGSERHRFVFMLRSGGNRYFQRYTSLSSSDQLFANGQSMRVNYQMNLRWNWTCQVDLLVNEPGWLKNGSAKPIEQSRMRMGFTRDLRDRYKLDLRVTSSGNDLKALVRLHQDFFSCECYAVTEIGYAVMMTPASTLPAGYYFAFDAGWVTGDGRFKFRTGVLIHRMDDNSPLFYRYEPDLYYQMSIPVISGSGYRAYLCWQWHITDEFTFETKLNRAYYLDRKSLGSGLEKIDKPFRSLLRLQLVYRPGAI